MIVAIHESMTLRKLDEDRYCLSGIPDQAGRCSGAIIGRNEAKAILQAWGVRAVDKSLDAA